jgi:hypothetical protein
MWPAWKKGAFAALLFLIVGPVTRGELHGPPGFLLLALGFVIWSARKARSPKRLRVANSYPELSDERRRAAESESDDRASEPPSRAPRQRRRHR